MYQGVGRTQAREGAQVQWRDGRMASAVTSARRATFPGFTRQPVMFDSVRDLSVIREADESASDAS